jgi:uncharacterized membrane protein YdfJ with MMPL/SSD domain
VTLAAGVITWALSPIKFQADMGILLAFMFLWNMVGAVVLIPALSHVLLRSGSAPTPDARSARARRLFGSARKVSRQADAPKMELSANF